MTLDLDEVRAVIKRAPAHDDCICFRCEWIGPVAMKWMPALVAEVERLRGEVRALRLMVQAYADPVTRTRLEEGHECIKAWEMAGMEQPFDDPAEIQRRLDALIAERDARPKGGCDG